MTVCHVITSIIKDLSSVLVFHDIITLNIRFVLHMLCPITIPVN